MASARPIQRPSALQSGAIALFLTALALPMAQMLVPLVPERANTENRALAGPPSLKQASLRGLRHFQQDLLGYFNDHYGFKAWLVHWDALANYRLFGTGINDGVVIGRDGWLYFQGVPKGGETGLGGAVPFSARELELIRSQLQGLDHALRARHTKLLVLLAPDKESVYSEFLPAGAPQGRRSRADQVAEALAGAGLAYVDLRRPLQAAKSEFNAPLYYLTDTHWNPLGAFVGQRELYRRLRTLVPGLEAGSKGAPLVHAVPNGGNGDLAGSLGLRGSLRDFDVAVVPAGRVTAAVPLPSPYFGLNDQVLAVPGSRAPRALVFRDSFFGFLLPQLSGHFSRSVYLWQNGVDLETVDKEKPDVVILEFIERNIRQLLQPVLASRPAGADPVKGLTQLGGVPAFAIDQVNGRPLAKSLPLKPMEKLYLKGWASDSPRRASPAAVYLKAGQDYFLFERTFRPDVAAQYGVAAYNDTGIELTVQPERLKAGSTALALVILSRTGKGYYVVPLDASVDKALSASPPHPRRLGYRP